MRTLIPAKTKNAHVGTLVKHLFCLLVISVLFAEFAMLLEFKAIFKLFLVFFSIVGHSLAACAFKWRSIVL